MRFNEISRPIDKSSNRISARFAFTVEQFHNVHKIILSLYVQQKNQRNRKVSGNSEIIILTSQQQLKIEIRIGNRLPITEVHFSTGKKEKE